MSTLHEVTHAALQLSRDQQAKLIETLRVSVEDLALEPELVAEWNRRVDELVFGAVEGLTAEESTSRLRAKFPWLR